MPSPSAGPHHPSLDRQEASQAVNFLVAAQVAETVYKLGVVAQACKLNSREAEAGESPWV